MHARSVERYKVMTLLIVSLSIGVYITIFGLYRLWQGRMIVGASELALGVYFLLSFWLLQKKESYYIPVARIFFVLVFALMVILTLYIPEERTHILWVPAVMVLIFFLLDTKAGLLFLALYQLFILYLVLAGYAYTVTEYITWSVSLLSLALVMYFYEKIKEQERVGLTEQSALLQGELQAKEKEAHTYIRMLRQSKERIEAIKGGLLLTQSNSDIGKACYQKGAQEMLREIAHHWRQPMMQISVLMMKLSEFCEVSDQKRELASYIDQIVVLTQEMSQTVESLTRLYEQHEDLKGADDA